MSGGPIRRAVVIGTGMMGPGIAATLAIGGTDACIVSRSAERAREGWRAACDGIRTLEDHEMIDAGRANRAIEHLAGSADLDSALAGADLVIESAPESMELKQDLFAHLDSIAGAHCILASNTSGLSITAVAAKCERPERVVTTHFWNPPHIIPLVEIVKGERTSHEIALQLRDLLKRCGKIPVIVKKDRPGQLGNRLQIALQREAMHIVAEGIADVEDVDLAAKNGFGLRMPMYGIFDHIDAVGLDLAGAVVDYVTRDLSTHVGMPEIMRDKIRDGATFHGRSASEMAALKQKRNGFLLDILKRYPRGVE